jgi:hemolysin activation/secretion protein
MVAKSPVMSPDVCVGVIHKLGFGGNNVVTTTEVMLGGNDRVHAYHNAGSTVGDRACRSSADLGRRHVASRSAARI